MKHITLYTDGACSGNPGPGGYGAILAYDGSEKQLSGGYAHTTNNRMELMGVIIGLSSLKEHCAVTVVSDSRYVVDAMRNGWAAKWRANGWKRNKRDYALNPDLWQRLLDLCGKHTVNFTWVNGHAGHPQNERCDRLAVAAAGRKRACRGQAGMIRFACLAIPLYFAAAGAGTLDTLVVRVCGLCRPGGVVDVTIYKNDSHYLKDDSCVACTRLRRLSSCNEGEACVSLALPPGEYAAVAYHDVNANGMCDVNFIGFPTEPIAFSRQFKLCLRPPKFDEISFVVDKPKDTIGVRLGK